MKALKFNLSTMIGVCMAFSPVFVKADRVMTDTNRRIVNIVNFIRQTEPRVSSITEEVLYQTVRKEVDLLHQYNMPGTFLLQYDALINPKYQQLLRAEQHRGIEIGAWWEITQPHVEAAGLKWRGRYSWDWHANVGFSTGYTPMEREKLVDVYMSRFKTIFGVYPKTVGSWFIDEHSLDYMYRKYHIVASCNCKDQIGTDGYTLWGGYWNQAYYPSKKNSYLPAQSKAGQIDVPVFRMLGSDPVYEYDDGIDRQVSGLETLEPVYPNSGGSKRWVEWFLGTLANEPCLGFAYAQAGQENSFTWENIKDGLEMQMPILDSLRKAGKITIETMGESGEWFKAQFNLTPATSVAALTDYRDEGHKTVWFNSRYYRANLFWTNNTIRFRDIHLFSEQYISPYFDKAGESTQCIYTALPVLNGFSWSRVNDTAGIRIMQIGQDGQRQEVPFKTFAVTQTDERTLEVTAEGSAGVFFALRFTEDHFIVTCKAPKPFRWYLEFKAAKSVALPFTTIQSNQIISEINNFSYKIRSNAGVIEKGVDQDFIYRIQPEAGTIDMDCTNK